MKNFITILFLFSFLVSFGQEVPDSYLRGRSLMHKNLYDSAIVHLNLALKENPANIDARYHRGICFFESKRYEEALEDFLQVNRRRAGKASLMLSRTESRLNHTDIAVRYLKEHLGSSYKIMEQEILLDADLSRLESSAAYKAMWKEREWYGPYDKKLQEAYHYKASGDYLASINLLIELDKNGFRRSLVNQYLAEIYLKTGNSKAALVALDKSINSDSRNIESLKLRITQYLKSEEFELAGRDCSRLLRQAPDEFEYYLINGTIESKLRNYENAVKSVQFYLALFPDSPEAYNTLGKIHFENVKYINALAAFNKTLELNQSNAIYFFNRGLAYAATKTYLYAAKDFSMALDLDPMNGEIWYNKGLADLNLQEIDSACFAFRKALQYGKYEAREYIDRMCNRK